MSALNNLNINAIFCEKYDQSSSSYIQTFDGLDLSKGHIDNFNLVFFTNNNDSLLYFIKGGFVKFNIDSDCDDGKGKEILDIIDEFSFIVPSGRGESKDRPFSASYSYIKEIDTNKLKGPGNYGVMAFGAVTENPNLDDMPLGKMELIFFRPLKITQC